MSKQKKRNNKKKEPAANPYAHMNPRRQKLHLKTVTLVFAVLTSILIFNLN